VKARILSLDSDEHRAAQELMPWFVNGTLDADEAALVTRHLAHCSRCQGDAAEQAELRAAAADHATGGSSVDRDWIQLRDRIAAPPRAVTSRSAASRSGSWKRWLPWAVALQSAVLLALVVVLFGAPRDERYHALGAPAAIVEPNAVAVFRNDATNRQIRDALRAAGARIVGGPTLTDAYLLRVESVNAETLARLRAQPGVLSVEALQGEALR
jgi:anti-sigma factor RsiW